MIKLEKINFGYNNNHMLFNSLNFFIPENGRMGLIGPNGSGKTTLLNIIMGFVKPSSGFLEIFGKVMKSEKDFQNIRMIIGYLFQNSDDQLFCPSVKEEVAFGPLNQRLPKSEIEKRVKESLEILGLKGFEERVPYHLSEGEKKRLAFATILAMKPKVLLLDEPTNGIDEDGKRRIENILNDGNYTYLVISQDIDFLKNTTDVLYTIQNGNIKKL